MTPDPDLLDLLQLLDLTDCDAVSVRVRSVTVTMAFRPDHEEIQRRAEAGLKGVTQHAALSLLMNMPTTRSLPLTEFSTRERRVLRNLPAGCVEETATGFRRLLVRPVHIEMALVRGQRWRTSLENAGMFAPHCARTLVFPGRLSGLDVKQTEADFWGIGLIFDAATRPSLLVRPEPFTRRRYTASDWAFVEFVYQQAAGLQAGK